MITILTSADRATSPDLFDQMFRGRVRSFHDRLGWDVNVFDGWEIDRYDNEEPVYLVSTDASRNMLGSLRLLPTMGNTMLRNELRNFFDEPVDIISPTAWECTRFCVYPQSEVVPLEHWRVAASELLIELCSLALSSGIEHIIGLYERPMARIYTRIGWEPELWARPHNGGGQLAVGIWDVSEQCLKKMRDIALTKGFQSHLNRFA